MISDKMAAMINEQIKNELYSGHLYLAMAAYCSSVDMDGMANFFVIQEQEERFHAMKFYHYLVEQNHDVKIYGLDQPKIDYKSLEEVFDDAWKHEQKVTKLINDLMALAKEENDYATQSFLHWYIDEQVEEEAGMLAILKKIRMVGEKGHGILMIDRELAQRSFTPPASEE
ncbi:MAG: ferritin [candidate division KSB1 bacterium]|jgi:ferritin|nr:ferritin [candidate division KSB1 bacterium]